MERLFFFVIAVALAFGVGCLGRNRKIGFGWAFGISLINVVIGLIVVLCSKKKTPNELEKKTKLKIWGWACILIGVIGFISIIMRGNPNLGPSVWVAIGVYLLYRKNT